MRIAQIVPLDEAVPPAHYGATQRVVSYLVDELIARGHDVTLFASGDSRTRAHLVAPRKRAWRLDPQSTDPLAASVLMLERVMRMRHRFDVLHFHTDYIHFPLCRLIGVPHVTTIHWRLDAPDLMMLYREFPDMPLVSVSDAQRSPLPDLRWMGTVYNGIPRDLYRAQDRLSGGYLAFLGRICPEKGIEDALWIARRTGMELRIAAKIDRDQRDYFRYRIAPRIRGSNARFLGEITDREKQAFLGNARALLFPVQWSEPFGMVLIEAMACGTPVIAYRRGAVPEIVEDGVTGYVVHSREEAAECVGHLHAFDRAAIRRAFERRFTAAHMTQEYMRIYEALMPEKNVRMATGVTASTEAAF